MSYLLKRMMRRIPHEHRWVRDGDSLLFVKCRDCDKPGVYTGRMEGLADAPPNGEG